MAAALPELRRTHSHIAFCMAALCLIFVPSFIAFTTIASYDTESPPYLALENRLAAAPKKPSPSSILNGSFQSSLEESLRDALPLRSESALANAFVQRRCIAASAFLLHEGIYPTYYGSTYAYDTSSDSIIPFPPIMTSDLRSSLESGANALNSIASRHPQIDVYCSTPPHLAYLPSNPLRPLISKVQDNTTAAEVISGQLEDDVSFVDLDPLIMDETKGSFRTEHHWSTEEAHKAYSGILAVMQPSAVPVTPHQIVQYEAPFYGSYARLGLCTPAEPDKISDLLYDESDISVCLDGRKGSLEDLRHRALYENKGWSTDAFTLRYEEYFHWNIGIIELTNLDTLSEKTLLLVGDSYTNSIERLFAENYKTVYCIDPRYYKESLESFLADRKVDDLLFLLCPPTLSLENVQRQISSSEEA